MEKKYILTEEQLLSLLKDRALLDLLRWDGVDNWVWYCESRDFFISTALGVPEEKVKEDNLSLKDVARKNLKCYENKN